MHDCLKDDMVSSENASAGIICIWKIMFKHQGFEKYMEGYFRSIVEKNSRKISRQRVKKKR